MINIRTRCLGVLQRLQSPIHIAAEQGYSEICKLLLSAGANIEQREQVDNINLAYYKQINGDAHINTTHVHKVSPITIILTR